MDNTGDDTPTPGWDNMEDDSPMPGRVRVRGMGARERRLSVFTFVSSEDSAAPVERPAAIDARRLALTANFVGSVPTTAGKLQSIVST